MLHAIRARPLFAVHARAAASARKEVGEDHPVADVERLAARIHVHAVTERGDAARAFVTLVDRQRPAAFCRIEVAAPGVQVGAAHVRQSHFDQRCAGLWLGYPAFFDLERHSHPVEDRRSS